LAPAFLFSINAKVNLKFNDFDEIASHPMAAPVLLTFEDLFKKLKLETPDTILD